MADHLVPTLVLLGWEEPLVEVVGSLVSLLGLGTTQVLNHVDELQ